MLDMTDAGQDDDDGDDLEKNCESVQLFSTTCVSKGSFLQRALPLHMLNAQTETLN